MKVKIYVTKRPTAFATDIKITHAPKATWAIDKSNMSRQCYVTELNTSSFPTTIPIKITKNIQLSEFRPY